MKKKENGNYGPSASPICHDKSGRACIINSVSGQAILLASAEDPAPNVALTAVASASPGDTWYQAMSDADKFEYDALFISNHSASVNWHKRRREVTSVDAFLASSLNTNACTTLSANAGPFILDSGATIHISPDASDFFDLKPIPP